MKRVLVLGLTMAVIAGAVAWWHHCTAVPKEEGIARLKSVRVTPFSDIMSSIASYSPALHGGKPTEVLDLPKDVLESSPNTQYYRISIGSRTALLLVEERPDGQVRAWLDTNLNNRFSDEEAITGIAKKRLEFDSYTLNYIDFGISQLIDGDFTSAPFYLLRYEGQFVAVSPTSYKRGRMLHGSRTYRLALVDGDYDGAYNSLFVPMEHDSDPKHDLIVLDGNFYGLFRRHEFDLGKLVPLSRYFKLDVHHYNPALPDDTEGHYYTFSISPDGKTVRMTSAEPAMGTLHVSNNTRFSARLLSDAAAQSVNFRGQIPLPAGVYQLCWNSATLTFTDPNGVDSQLRADFRNAVNKGIFEIAEGQTTTLDPGPPFTFKTEVVKRSDEQLSINAKLVGNVGETYGLRMGHSARRPELKILTENGDTLHTGSMEYG